MTGDFGFHQWLNNHYFTFFFFNVSKLPIRLNPRREHQTGSKEPSAGGYFCFLFSVCAMLVVSERRAMQCLPYNAERQAR